MNIRVSVEDALGVLKTNRGNHIKDYEAQMDGWKLAMASWQVELSKWKDSFSSDAKDKSKENRRPEEPYKPCNYINDYDKYIVMLEWHQDPAIVLTEHEFNMIIKNEFSWRSGFIASNNIYTNTLSAGSL